MTKTDFLETKDVATFVNWLVERLPGFSFRLRFSPSRYVPGGLVADASGLEQVLHHYMWRASWTDGATSVQSGNWATTRRSLQRLREKLQTARNTGDEEAMLEACFAVLEWGGVASAKPFLRRKASSRELVDYMRAAKDALDLDAGKGKDQDKGLGGIDGVTVERFDAGLTKIHALLDTTGLPIYDSRVGAAIAMFYALYRAERGQDALPAFAQLRFPSGSARGSQVRNPGDISRELPSAPQFYTARVSHVSWAQSQVKLGWIIQAVLKRTDWFSDIADGLAARAHAFEAAMFMVGYDLRCLSTEALATPLAPEPVAPGASANWVPTAHTFNTQFLRYVEYRKALAKDGMHYDDGSGDGFRKWSNLHHGPYAQGALRALCYPFRQAEFNLFERSLSEIVELDNAAANNDTAALLRFLNEFANQSDERSNVCLVDVWAVGVLRAKAYNGVQSRDALVRAGFAGTKAAAATLCNVGVNVGRYLRLLDENNYPTQLFHDYFGDRLQDLTARLDRGTD